MVLLNMKKIVFYQPYHDDPEYLLKACYLIMTYSGLEVQYIICNLWLGGLSSSKHDHPNFGRHDRRNYFKAFAPALPYFFSSKKWWHSDKRAKPWDMILPNLNINNER